jgi:hypothetical protein
MRVPLGSGHSHVPRYLHTPSSSHVDASHMGPKFRSSTKGSDYDTLPTKSTVATVYPKLEGGKSFQKGRGKAFEEWFWRSCFEF